MSVSVAVKDSRLDRKRPAAVESDVDSEDDDYADDSLEEDEDDDDDADSFIDDGSGVEEDYSHYIRELFGYDRRKYVCIQLQIDLTLSYFFMIFVLNR